MAAEAVVTIEDGDTVGGGSNSVTIWCTKLDHNLDKPLLSINMPNLKAEMDDETEPTTKNIDIGKVKEIVTVAGFLIDEDKTISGNSAFEKKANLIKLVKFKRTVTLSWGSGVRQGTATGNINKCNFTETPGIIGTQDSTTRDTENTTLYRYSKNYAVQFSVIVGTDQ